MICHGDDLKDEKPTLSMSAWISNVKKEMVLLMLYKGFTPQQVFEMHIQQVSHRFIHDPHVNLMREDYLSLKDIFNISQRVAIHKYQLHQDDAESRRCWVMENPIWVFYYQQQVNSNGSSFILGIQSPWQREMCYAFGNNNVLAMDSTFGANQYKMTLYTIIVFDHHRNGVLVSWIIASSSRRIDIVHWFKAFQNVILDKLKSWAPNALLVDDATPERDAIRYI